MGKKSKSGKDKPSAATIAKGEEELLEKAVAENKAAREKEIADGCPTKAELVAALDQITLFDLRVMENGKGTQTCLSPEGDYIFYVDCNDAAEALQARKMTHAGHLVLGTTPLGKVFGLTEADAFGFQSNVAFPMYLQGSTAVIDDLVRDGLDEGAKSLCPVSSQLNPKSSTVPMFSFPELVEGTTTAPYFFTKADLVHHWMSSTGKTLEELPPRLIMTDLRVLILRMMTEPADWKTIQIAPLTSTVEFLAAASQQRVQATQPAEAATGTAGAPPLASVAEADEPPALE